MNPIIKWFKSSLSAEERETVCILNDSGTSSMNVIGRGTLTMDTDEARTAMLKDVYGVEATAEESAMEKH